VQVAREDVGRGTAGTGPAGIVFHVARCGSTLVSQLLKQHVGLVVYAEPLPVNEILLPPAKWPRAEIVAALRSLGAAFERHARKPWVLKLTSWNTLFCDLVAEAFPSSPWVLCLRDPLEIAVSLLRQPAGWIWDEAGPGRAVREADRSRRRVPVARRVRRAHLGRALRGCEPPGSRARLAGRLHVAALRRLGARRAALRAAGRRYGPCAHAACRVHGLESARGPGRQGLRRTPRRKQQAATDGLRRAVDEFARPPFEALRRRRS
jgi:hypothetical protein